MNSVRGHIVERLVEDASFSHYAIRYWKILCLQGNDMDPEGRAPLMLEQTQRKLKGVDILHRTGASNQEYSRALKMMKERTT